MKGFGRSVIIFVIVAALVVAVYRLFGGDLGALANGIWGVLYAAITAVADVFVKAFAVFGIG